MSAAPVPPVISSRVLLQARDVSVSFGAVQALTDVSLELHEGEILGLAGENGAGKSTLINVFTGALAPTRGEVLAGGEVPPHWSPDAAHRAGVRAVYQELSLAPDLSVATNMFAGEWPTGRFGQVNRRAMLQRAQRVLEDLGARINARELVRRLPLGDQQVVEYAKAVLDAPGVLILDEVTSALGSAEVEQVFRATRRLREAGTAVVFVSHRMGELFALCNRIAVLKDGALVAVRVTAETNEDELVELMIGREPVELFPAKPVAGAGASAAGLRVDGLTCPGVVHDLSFEVAPGEIVGLGGLQGHGQKEVLQALFGMRASSGRVSLQGRERRWRHPGHAMRDGVAYVPEDRKSQGLLLPLSVGFNTSLPSIRALSVPPGIVNRRREASLIREVVERLRVRAASFGMSMEGLSGGNQQKVALGKWLPRSSRLYLFDEPTRGIDVGTKADLYRLIRDLAAEGAIVVLTSSETMELVGLCDRVVVLFEGRAVTTLTGADVTEENLVRASVTGSVGRREAVS